MRANIVLIGEEAAVIEAAKLVTASVHPLIAVVSDSVSPSLLAVSGAAQVPIWPSSRVKQPDFPSVLAELGTYVLLNVHSLKIIPQRLIDAVTLGAFNLHPGPLPHYAGLNTPSWALYQREEKYGVTLHWMDSGIDTGAIAYQAEVPILPGDTGIELSVRCTEENLKLLQRLLFDLEHNHPVPRVAQDFSRRRCYRAGAPYRSAIDWQRPAREIEALVRASDYRPFPSPWGAPSALIEGQEVGLVEVALTGNVAHAAPGTLRWDGEYLDIATSDEWLELLELRVHTQDFQAAAWMEARGKPGKHD